jgi:ribonuclease P protein component
MYKLAKNGILRKNKHFQTVYRVGKSFANKQLVLYVLRNKSGTRKIGFAAGKRLGNAVVRNRVKRLLREAYRLNQYRLVNGVDLIIVGRQPIIKQKLEAVSAAFIQICIKAGILAEQ